MINAIFEKVYKGSFKGFKKDIYNDIKNNNKRFIVTANPETFMIAKKDNDFLRLLLDKQTTIVADGIGIVKSGRKLGYNIEERIPGIDISLNLLKICNELKKDLYVFGSTEKVINLLRNVLNESYPHINLVGVSSGYVEDKDKVFKEIINLEPDIILVALGIPHQEKIIYRYLNKFHKGVFIGVGGSIDVLSGCKKRAPKLLIKLNLEWLYRIIKEPKRIKRFYQNNIKFMFSIKKEKEFEND
ncbi:MAG: WecB/TagA/CpsF family glycosyltransferase [Bacilli bacterium]|nr:WecB/TagA/CpsF family glycosyltransferase [Bacilli bacterium]